MSVVTEPSYRKRVGYQAGLLGGFSTVAAVLLISGNIVTREPIAEREKEDLLLSLSQVIPAHLYDQDLLGNTLVTQDDRAQDITVYRAVREGTVSGLAFEQVGQGYAGDIRVLMGVDSLGQLLGVRVLSHAETPGLGDKIEPERDNWIFTFNGRSLGDPPANQWAVKKDGGYFDQFSGATITPRAVVGAVKNGLLFFRAQRDRLTALAETAKDTATDKREHQP